MKCAQCWHPVPLSAAIRNKLWRCPTCEQVWRIVPMWRRWLSWIKPL